MACPYDLNCTPPFITCEERQTGYGRSQLSLRCYCLLSCGVTHFWIRTHISVILIFELLLIFGEFYVWQPKNPEKPKQHGSPTFRRRRRSHS